MRVISTAAALLACLILSSTSGQMPFDDRIPARDNRASAAQVTHRPNEKRPGIGRLANTAGVRNATNIVNVLEHGVHGTGCRNDDGPALRAIFSGNISGKTILFPADRVYCFRSRISPGDYPHSDQSGVFISRKSNFRVVARGATFTVDPTIPLTATVTFDRATDWSWEGGTFIGVRSGLKARDENVGMMLLNVERFKISGTRFTGYGGNGAAYAGDWIVDGRIANQKMDGVGICFDFAFVKTLVIRNVVATGADTDNKTGVGKPGNKCFSIIHDGPLAGFNRTGHAYDTSQNVRVERLDASDFHTGVAVSSGRNMTFINNSIHDNPGHGPIGGIGYYFYYSNGGNFTSVGTPLSDVRILEGEVVGNGAATPGYGVLIDAEPVTNDDRMSGFIIKGVRFRNNAKESIRARGTALSNVLVDGKRRH